MWRRGGAIGCALVVLSNAVGCGTTATIARSAGPNVEGRIKGGSSGSVLIRDNSTGVVYAVPRSEIREIDHPGNVAATLGGVVAGVGLLNLAGGWETCRDDERFASNQDQNAYCAGLVTPLAVGTALLLYGIIVHSGSKSRAADTSQEVYAPPYMQPPVNGPWPPPPPPWAAPAPAGYPPTAPPAPPPTAAPTPPVAVPPAAAPTPPVAAPPAAPPPPPAAPAAPPGPSAPAAPAGAPPG